MRIPQQHSIRKGGTHGITFWLECCLWIAGIIALGYCGFFWGRMIYDQAAGEEILRTSTRDSAPIRPGEGTPLGRISIARLGISAVIFEGTSDGTLARGVGHLISSPHLGSSGNLVLAAHRDTFFRPLRHVRPGDQIEISSGGKAITYVVESTSIVAPDATEVLKPTSQPTLTLITCYPFTYIGNAPERFIVRARQVAASTIS